MNKIFTKTYLKGSKAFWNERFYWDCHLQHVEHRKLDCNNCLPLMINPSKYDYNLWVNTATSFLSVSLKRYGCQFVSKWYVSAQNKYLYFEVVIIHKRVSFHKFNSGLLWFRCPNSGMTECEKLVLLEKIKIGERDTCAYLIVCYITEHCWFNIASIALSYFSKKQWNFKWLLESNGVVSFVVLRFVQLCYFVV